jgi:hypothetical protein
MGMFLFGSMTVSPWEAGRPGDLFGRAEAAARDLVSYLPRDDGHHAASIKPGAIT